MVPTNHSDSRAPQDVVIRPATWGHRNRGIPYCKRGHEFTATNTYLTARGSRQCKKCRHLAYRQWVTANPERSQELKRTDYMKHRASNLEKRAAYYQKNKQRMDAWQREYASQHREARNLRLRANVQILADWYVAHCLRGTRENRRPGQSYPLGLVGAQRMHILVRRALRQQPVPPIIELNFLIGELVRGNNQRGA